MGSQWADKDFGAAPTLDPALMPLSPAITIPAMDLSMAAAIAAPASAGDGAAWRPTARSSDEWFRTAMPRKTSGQA